MPGHLSYLLAPHVFVCRLDKQSVILDLKADRYFAVGAAELEAIQGASHITEGSTEQAASLFEQMRSSNMRTRDPARGKDIRAVRALTPIVALITGYQRPNVRFRFIDVVRFCFVVGLAATAFRLLPLSRAVAYISRRRARLSDKTASVSPLSRASLESLRETVQRYETLRPLLFTGHDACLLDSFSLAVYLIQSGYAPHWIFGVKAQPFSAHCWLQIGSTVLNDTPEHVRTYTQIMIV
jgi:hypothetical protein